VNPIVRIVLRSIKLLNSQQKKRILISLCAQIILNVLDTLSLVLLSLASLLVLQKGDENQSSILSKLSDLIDLKDPSARNVIVIIAFLALLIRGIGTLVFTKYVLRICNEISISLANKILLTAEKINPINYISIAENDLTKLIAVGSKAIGSGIFAFSILALSEFIFLILLTLPLLAIAPLVTVLIGLTFGIGIYLVQKRVGEKSEASGFKNTQYDNSAKMKIARLGRIRKFTVISGNTKKLNQDLLNDLRTSLDANGILVYYQQVPKVAMETLLLACGFFIVTYYSILGDFEKGFATIILLLAISYRLLPTILRMQNALIFVRANIMDAEKYLEFFEYVAKNERERLVATLTMSKERNNVLPEITIKNLNYRFSASDELIFDNLNLEIRAGSFTALIGESGSGKSTLIDLILGYREQESGQILIEVGSGINLRVCYMPQETVLLPVSLMENIAVGVPIVEIDLELVRSVLKTVSLERYLSEVESSPESIGTFQLSGGEIQRVGLARCLYLQPNLLLLDEPTSSLDAVSEKLLFESISNLKDTATILMVTHSTQVTTYADSICELN